MVQPVYTPLLSHLKEVAIIKAFEERVTAMLKHGCGDFVSASLSADTSVLRIMAENAACPSRRRVRTSD